MQGSQALALVAELEASFARKLPGPTKEAYIRELEMYPFEEGEFAVRNLIRTEDRFPSIATLLTYISEERQSQGTEELSPEQNRKALNVLRKDIAHLANQRREPFTETLRGHLSMCQENADLAGDNVEERETWDRRAGWCRELLAKQSA